jgi:hypothetical protein
MHESLDMAGRLTIVMRDRKGRVVLEHAQRNRIVAGGRRLVAEMFSGTGSEETTHPISAIAVGTSGQEPADKDAGLAKPRGAPKPVSKVDVSEITDASGVQRIRVQLTTQFDFGEANDASTPLREAGLLNDKGLLYSRVVFKDVTKTDTFQLTLMWEIVF